MDVRCVAHKQKISREMMRNFFKEKKNVVTTSLQKTRFLSLSL